MKEEEGTCGEGRVPRISSSVLVVEQEGMRWRGRGGGGRKVREENKGQVFQYLNQDPCIIRHYPIKSRDDLHPTLGLIHIC